MPISFDNTPDYTLHGLFRLALDVLDRLPFWAPAAVAAAAALAVVSSDIRNPAAGDIENPATLVTLMPRPAPVRWWI